MDGTVVADAEIYGGDDVSGIVGKASHTEMNNISFINDGTDALFYQHLVTTRITTTYL